LALPIDTTVELVNAPAELTSVEFVDSDGNPVDMNIANSNSSFVINYSS
jgi:hypothetical protein